MQGGATFNDSLVLCYKSCFGCGSWQDVVVTGLLNAKKIFIECPQIPQDNAPCIIIGLRSNKNI